MTKQQRAKLEGEAEESVSAAGASPQQQADAVGRKGRTKHRPGRPNGNGYDAPPRKQSPSQGQVSILQDRSYSRNI